MSEVPCHSMERFWALLFIALGPAILVSLHTLCKDNGEYSPPYIVKLLNSLINISIAPLHPLHPPSEGWVLCSIFGSNRINIHL